MTSKSRHIGDAVRSVIIIGIAGIVAIRGREWILYWNIQIRPTTYFWIAYTYMGLVVWLTTRKLLRNLRTEAKAQLASRTFASDLVSTTPVKPLGSVFRYPYYLGFLVAIVATYFFCVPLVYRTAPQGYLITFSIAIITLLADIYLIRYRVYISDKTFTLRGFSDKKYAFSDINKLEVSPSKNGPVAVVFLVNGEVLRFSGMLKNFASLVSILRSNVEERESMTNGS